MLDERRLCAGLKVAAQPNQANPPNGTLVHEWDKPATSCGFDRHFGHHGDSHAGGNHAQNGGKLTGLEHHVELQAGPLAGRHNTFAEAMAFFEKQKWIGFDMF